jgi:hypothetical protein
MLHQRRLKTIFDRQAGSDIAWSSDGRMSGTKENEVVAAIPAAFLLYVKERLFKTGGSAAVYIL